MIIEIQWSTEYEYGDEVHLLHNELRVLPEDGQGQSVLEESLEVDPSGDVLRLTDAFGNRYHHTSAMTGTGLLRVIARSQVATTGASAEATLTPLLSYLYRQPTARAPFDPRLERYADVTAGDVLTLARQLSDRITGEYEYAPGFTDASSTAADLLKGGRGVCQDFAHLLLAALRTRGVIARYVSGYLSGDEASAMHAWVQVLYEGHWFGLDPANGIAQDDRYVFVAAGRDYDDVTPIRGTYAGTAPHLWSADVRAREASQ